MAFKHLRPEADRSRGRWSRTLCLTAGLLCTLPAVASTEPTAESAPRVATNLQSNKTVKVIGVVTDSKTGEPIVGANLKIKGTTRGTATDIDGRFELQASPNDVLEFSYVGFVSKSIKVGKQRLINVTLVEDDTALDAVVVTAFGTGQKKETLTGAIQSVRPGELRLPSANLSSSFAGRLAGVIAYQRSGEPGTAGADFFIRGVATTNNSNPLIVIDGVEVSRADLNFLDPEVIESFSILKDASTTAMYGSRGANGVMIIKTKTGADLERPIISVRLENYMNTPINVPQIADAATFMRMYNEAVTNQGTGAVLYSEDRINGTIQGLDPYAFPNVNWYKEIFNDRTFNQKANLSVRGGTSKITYFMSASLNHETGMLRGRSKDFFSYDNSVELSRLAFQNNINYNLSKAASIALQLSANFTSGRGPVTSSNGSGGVNEMFSAIMNTNPVDYPIYYPQGQDEWIHWGTALIGSSTISNPMAVASIGYKDFFTSTVNTNLSYSQKLDFITKGLSFKALASFKNWTSSTTFRHQNYESYTSEGYEKNADGSYTINQKPISGTPGKHVLGSNGASAGDRRIYLEATLSWARRFGKHNLASVLVYNQDQFNGNINGTNLIASLPKRRQGIAGRLTYDYDNRYILEFNAGYNGSENFAKGHRFGFFPAVSAGWVISQEPFWEPLRKKINNLKVRASYGLVGNDNISGARFAYMPIVDLNHKNGPSYRTGYDGQYETRKGAVFSRLANPSISWEIGRKLNVGLDLRLWNALSLTLEAFQEVRSDVFLRRNSIPNSLGASTSEIWGNFGKIKNWGFDASAEYNKKIGKDWTISFRSNFTFARNRVLEYDEAPGMRNAIKRVGNKLNAILGYQADGLYIDQADINNSAISKLGNIAIAPGDIKYVDQPDNNGEYDGQINSDDRVVLGYPHVPEIVYGFGPSITYKNWDFSFFFQGTANVSLMMNGFHPFGTQSRRNVLQWVANDYWSPTNQNPNAHYPRLTHHDNNHNAQSSSYWLRDGSFLRLKSLELGYAFWKRQARVFVSATNVFNISAFKLWDPEMGGGRGMSYPLQRTINLGVQVTFK